MIKFENIKVEGLEAAIRGMRNPLNSWDKSDSHELEEFDTYKVGTDDLKLARKLATYGPVHAKYRRMIIVYADITAPLYWWKEFDTYKVGTVANSCSTMHTLHKRDLTLEDFSCEWVLDESETLRKYNMLTPLETSIAQINLYRKLYLETEDKKYWYGMIQLLPSSFNQKRTIMMNYEVLASIYPNRYNHKLNEWVYFCNGFIRHLPYAEEMILP